MHEQLLRWRNLIPIAAVFLIYIPVAIAVRVGARRLMIYLRARKGRLEEVLPPAFDEAMEECGSRGLLVGVAGISETGLLSDVGVCSFHSEASAATTQIVKSISRDPAAIAVLKSNTFACGGGAKHSRAVSLSRTEEENQVPFVLASARRQPTDEFQWLAFVADVDARGSASFGQSEDADNLLVGIAETVAKLKRKQGRPAYSVESSTVEPATPN
jgi:hypothetical protein